MTPPRTAAEVPLVAPADAVVEALPYETGGAASWSRQDFQAAVKPLLPRLHRLCLALSHDDASADDLLQAGLVRAYVRLARYTARGSFFGWLCQVVRNVHADTSRTEARRRTLFEAAAERLGIFAESFDSASMDPETWICDADDASLLMECLRNVPERYRTVLLFCDVEEMTHVEAAEALGVPLGTVKSRQMRGRRMLRAAYEARLGEAEITVKP